MVPHEEVGHTDEAKKEIQGLFQTQTAFDTPKPTRLLERVLQIATNPGDIVLDSFAGSGTTGHAFLKLNEATPDDPPRRFVMVEMEPDLARNITAERVRRVAEGYTSNKGKSFASSGGGFRFCELGGELFDEYGQIHDEVTFGELARHVWFTEFHEPLPRERVPNSPFLGECNGVGLYLLYNGILGDKSNNGGNVLTRAILERLPQYDGPKIIFCAGNLLGPDRLRAASITIRQTPYEIKVS
jgi:site-specific DNA-methyltransferase (adenine-specific)/adenine-specific DNA-methyltransferase